jgi:mRNA-degrading endonuclease YafQ of YafQ-DinJ toxin-antitoxin module
VAKGEYVFKRSQQFKKSFDSLSPEEQAEAKRAFAIFKEDPFDPRLRTHKIIRLSALYKRTIRSVTVAPNLRAVFYIDGNKVVSLDIGTHDIYE